MSSRLMSNTEKFEEVVRIVNEHVEMSADDVADFVDGGDEGWDCGDEEQSQWLDTATAKEISSWVIAGQP